MNKNDLSYLIRGVAFKRHSALGPGLLESVYEVALSHELKTIGLEVKNEVGIPFIYAEIRFDIGFRLDIIVNDKVIMVLCQNEWVILQHGKVVIMFTFQIKLSTASAHVHTVPRPLFLKNLVRYAVLCQIKNKSNY